MIHNLRRKDGTIYPLDVEIGSGITDKNGREIFEGDIVKIENCLFEYTVLFINGVFVLGQKLLKDFPSKELEVVGHVED